MRRTAALVVLATGLAACGGGDAETARGSDTAATPGMGADSAVPATAGTPADSATARDLVDAPAAGVGIGRATATVRDAGGRELGVLTVAETAGALEVTGQLSGLPPGEHAIHFHTTGRCEPPFESAGGHWNPTNAQHGSQAPGGPHLGDLPNMTVGADSTVAVRVTSPGGMLRTGDTALLDADGAALVIHAGADDYRTQPSGDSGGRIACGVVEMGS